MKKDVYFSKHENDDFDEYEDISSGRRDEIIKKEHKKKHRARRTIIFLLLIVLVVILVILAYVMNIISKIDYVPDAHLDNEYISDSALKHDSKVKNILLLGSDIRDGQTDYRTDTMIIMSIDSKSKEIKLTSLLRDSWVEIPGHSEGRLNSASSLGGIQLCIDTIEYNYKIRIDNYMLVDFAAFEKVIDAVGGVDVDVSEKEAEACNKEWPGVNVVAGSPSHLDGNQATCYCRIRKLDSDFKRTERQRKVLSAVKTSLSGLSPFELGDIAKEIFPYIDTDISQEELLSLCIKAAIFYLDYDMSEYHVPEDGSWENTWKGSQQVITFDIDEASSSLINYIYG